ncbi:DUF262 domain-containing protein [Carboxydothermus pertinax]|uniref:DUF262 domain-containing protein n=1 Tax=Carboxydothermus pertinax TaxID=870242 RepID=A0A1L8CV35_9THEO|nr:DUF262 domain-containing protein [Carboxydothermus pertinax]GAV22724.1 hypothetical protein cpu_12340 [Carboxydothermus pertinax]
MPGEINAVKKKLVEIFSHEFWFLVPEYQRPYVWQDENIVELIDDLYYAFTNKQDSEYFLGSLVLKKTETKDYPEYEVLDGQQRLTTFFLMFAVLRDLIAETEYKDTLQELIYQKENKLKKIPSRKRMVFKIRDDVEKFIEEYIIKIGGTKEKEKLEEYRKSENPSISNMASAVLLMNELFQEKTKIEEFVEFILNKALFISVSTDNTEDAFRLFTILNDRGIPLTNADILKSKNIGAISDENEVRKYAREWEELEEYFGEKFDRFLAFIRTIFVKEKARANLLNEFENNIYGKGKLKLGKETIDLLKTYQNIYEKIIELSEDSLPNDYKNLITIMKIGLPSDDWVPPLLYFYYKYHPTDKLLEFLRKLEYKFAGDWICQKTPTERIEAVNKILREIEDTEKEEIDKLLNSSVFLIDAEELQRNLNDENFYRKPYCKYVLLKIEYLFNDQTAHLSSYKKISVEHVLPQNPKPDSKWVQIFSLEERQKWTNRLANLVLIGKMKNSQLSNLDFQEKKERYLRGRVDAFKASKIFIENTEDWTPELLEKRQKYLINMLVQNKFLKNVEGGTPVRIITELPRPYKRIEWNDPINITKDQWKKALLNSNITTTKDLALLLMIYTKPFQCETASNLADEIGKNYQYLNSIASRLGKRIAEHFGIEVPKEKNKPNNYNYWHIPFLGAKHKKEKINFSGS